MPLHTRPPTGKMAPPVILLEGEEGSRKSWTAAELSKSAKVNRTYWLEIGTESTADEYGQIPGVRYEIVQHDGTWSSIYGQVREAREAARESRRTTGKPDVLVVDQVGAMWDMLSEWGDNRCRSSKTNKQRLEADPNAEIDITANYWNDATTRWRRFMTACLTFPGIVILISRGRETTLFRDGKPVSGKKDYKVEGQKGLTWDVPVWIRMSRDGNPMLIKLRSVKHGIQPGERSRALPGFDLETFIFDRLGYDPAVSRDRTIVELQPGADAPMSDTAAVYELAITSAEDEAQLRAAWERMDAAAREGQLTADEKRQLTIMVHHRKRQLTSDETGPVTVEPQGEQARMDVVGASA